MEFFDISSLKANEALNAYDNHEEMVNEYLSLLGAGYCFQIGFSSGKDSSTVLNGAIDAMNRALLLGIIENDHPLVVLTVDTLLEQEITQAYVPFAHRSVREKCTTLGINLIIEIVSPPIHHQLMILYAGAQKLPATSASGRHSDCSIIFKVDVGVSALKRIKETLRSKYQKSVWISVSGSRSDESTRRAQNMKNQNVKGVKSSALIERIENSDSKSEGKTYKFAPISDWSTADVMSYLSHCGDNSVSKTRIDKKIMSYGENFGLLIAIYGQGSQDTCELVISDEVNKVEQKGCGKVGRYGCVTCGMISEDKSSIELKKFNRWGRFGDYTLRFRDYLVRISSDIKYRAFHARAYDPSANNNVFLQPNTLKAATLEKMVWYASQITEHSRAIHKEALDKYNKGLIDEDIGVIEIMNDHTLSVSVKQQFKDMYIARLIEKPFFEIFTEKHAVLLSLLWSLHGVSAVVNRPVAILDSVKKGKKIPFPLTNSELNEKRKSMGLPAWDDKSVLNNTVPDALVVQLYKPAEKTFTELKCLYGDQLNESHLQSFMPFSITDAWNKAEVPFFNVIGKSYHHTHTEAKRTRTFKLTYSINLNTLEETVKAKDQVTGKNINTVTNPLMLSLLLKLGRKDYQEELIIAANNIGIDEEELALMRSEKGGVFGITCNHEFNNQFVFSSDVKFIEKSKLRSKGEAGKKHSKRKRAFDKETNSFKPGRASLKTYSSTTVPALENQATQVVSYWLPDFAVVRQSVIDTHNYDEISSEESKLSFVFNDQIFNDWISMGGWSCLVADHDIAIASLRKSRRPMRTFCGTAAVYNIMCNTGLTATIHFKKYLLETLKRTELFHSFGLFNLASSTAEKIMNSTNVISMADHRTQKADYLLAIRYLKNKRRNTIKSARLNYCSSSDAMANDAVNNVSIRINEFVEQYKSIIKSYIATLAFSAFSCDAKSRLEKITLWLLDYNSVLKGVDNALLVLSTTKEMALINNDFESKLVITNIFNKQTTTLLNEIEEFVKKPQQALASIKKENLKSNLSIVNGHYESSDEVGLYINELAVWIADNYQRINVYLIEHGITACLAQSVKLPYVCPVMGSPVSSNTPEKLNARANAADSVLRYFDKSLSLTQAEILPLMKIKDLVSNHKRISIGNISITAKSSKLANLMADKVNKMRQLRVK